MRGRAAAHLRAKGVRLPTFRELAEPAGVPREIRASLEGIDPDIAHPANLYRVNWYNDLKRTGLAATPVFVELPATFNGVKARIVLELG